MNRRSHCGMFGMLCTFVSKLRLQTCFGSKHWNLFPNQLVSRSKPSDLARHQLVLQHQIRADLVHRQQPHFKMVELGISFWIIPTFHGRFLNDVD